MLAGISGNMNVKVRNSQPYNLQDIYDYFKPLLKKKPNNMNLNIGANNLVVFHAILSFKDLPNSFYQSDNEKTSQTVENVNGHLDALNINVVHNRYIGGNFLKSSGLCLNSTGYGNLVNKLS